MHETWKRPASLAAIALLASVTWTLRVSPDGAVAAASTRSRQQHDPETSASPTSSSVDRTPIVPTEPARRDRALDRPTSIVIGGVTHDVAWDGDVRRVYRPSGSLLTVGAWGPDGREGVHRSFHDNGARWGTENWSRGLREGWSEIDFPDGTPAARGAYSHGFKNGLWRTWYASGAIESEGAYIGTPTSQKRHGHWAFFDGSGNVIASRSGTYHHGDLVHDDPGD